MKKPDAVKVVVPSGHDGARQALRELRRILDAERHRIRRKLIRVRHATRRDNERGNQPHWLKRDRWDSLVTNALAAITAVGSLVIGAIRPLLGLCDFAMRAAISEKIEAVSRQNEQGYDRNK